MLGNQEDSEDEMIEVLFSCNVSYRVDCPPTWTSNIMLQGVNPEELNTGGTPRSFFTQNREEKSIWNKSNSKKNIFTMEREQNYLLKNKNVQ